MMNNTTYGTFLNEKKFQSLSKEISPYSVLLFVLGQKNIRVSNAKCFVPDWFMARSPNIIDATVCKILILVRLVVCGLSSVHYQCPRAFGSFRVCEK